MTTPRPRRRRRPEFADCQAIDDNVAQALKESEPSEVPPAPFTRNTPFFAGASRDAGQLLAIESIARSLERLVSLAEKAAR